MDPNSANESTSKGQLESVANDAAESTELQSESSQSMESTAPPLHEPESESGYHFEPQPLTSPTSLDSGSNQAIKKIDISDCVKEADLANECNASQAEASEKFVLSALDGHTKPENRAEHEVRKQGYVRHCIALLALSSIVLANMNRQVFNQNLVSMTKRAANKESPVANIPTIEIEANTSYSEPSKLDMSATQLGETHLDNGNYSIAMYDEDRFDWTANEISLLQMSFYFGYTPFMIPGGRLSEIYGAKWIVFVSGFGSALCCILAPLFADLNYYLLVASRVIMGLAQTGVSPALYALLSRWLPPDESSVYLPMIKVAVQLGFALGALVSGFISWRIAFYIVGIIGIFWSIIWSFIATSDPSSNKLLGKPELDYVRKELGLDENQSNGLTESDRKKSAPWLAILTNPIVLALMFAKFTVKLATDIQTIQIPMFLKNVFHISEELNGILSATGSVIQGVFTGFVAYAAKELIIRKVLPKTGVRRLFQGICNFGMALSLVLLAISYPSLELACGAIALNSIAAMFGSGGEALTPVDLSRKYSASIMATANSAANLSGIILPALVSMIVGQHKEGAVSWMVVLLVLASIIAFGGLLYTCFVKAEIQDFDNLDKRAKLKNESLENGKAREVFSMVEIKTR